MKRLINPAIVFCAAFMPALLLFAAPASAEENGQRIFDAADLFSEDEESEIEEVLKDAITRTDMDIVVVTTNDAEGKSSAEYADDYFDYGGFGKGSDRDGYLYLIDMDNREIYISTSGVAIRYYTDERIERLLDIGYKDVADGKYADSAIGVIKEANNMYLSGIEKGQYNYDTETGKKDYYDKKDINIFEAFFALLGGLVPAFVHRRSVLNEYSMKNQKANIANLYRVYRANAEFAYGVDDMNLIDTQISRRMIPVARSGGSSSRGGSAGRSSTHRSSSGRSHGGGGRRF